MNRIQFFLTLFFISGISYGQDLSAYEKKWLEDGNDTLPYRLLMPENYDASKKYPLVLFLHGSGERGNDNGKQLIHGGKLFLRDDIRKNYPAIVVFPQCPANERWAGYFSRDTGDKKKSLVNGELVPYKPLKMVEQLLTQMQAEFSVDTNRIYVGGLSLGGIGTFAITNRNPELFAAAFPICGAADETKAGEVRNISWWIFHGAKDNVVPPASSIKMAAALENEKADVKFTLYPEANHNSWDPAFAEPDLMKWMFGKRKQ